MLMRVGRIVRKDIMDRAKDVLFLDNTQRCNSHFFIFNSINHGLFETMNEIVIDEGLSSTHGEIVKEGLRQMFTEKWY